MEKVEAFSACMWQIFYTRQTRTLVSLAQGDALSSVELMSQSYIVRPLRSVQTYGTRNADAAQQRSKDIFQQALQHLNARESHLKQQSGNAFTRALSPTQREKLVSDVQWAQRRTTCKNRCSVHRISLIEFSKAKACQVGG